MYNTDLPNRAELPSSGQLFRSTIIAIIVAAVLLIAIVLPSEYGIDPTGIGRVIGLTQMGEIKISLAEEARKATEAENAQRTSGSASTADQASTTPAPTAITDGSAARTDEMTVTLKPGEGAEIKLEMAKGAAVDFQWTTTGGGVNFDLHGDNANKDFISYKKGTAADGDSGALVAQFDGSHGWFWRNRSQSEVTITIKATGAFQSMKRVA